MPFPVLSKTTIRQQADEASFQKGLAYYQQGAVVSLVKRGDHVQAEVAGSEYTPYRVRIGLDAGGITSAECTCPYDRGGGASISWLPYGRAWNTQIRWKSGLPCKSSSLP